MHSESHWRLQQRPLVSPQDSCKLLAMQKKTNVPQPSWPLGVGSYWVLADGCNKWYSGLLSRTSVGRRAYFPSSHLSAGWYTYTTARSVGSTAWAPMSVILPTVWTGCVGSRNKFHISLSVVLVFSTSQMKPLLTNTQFEVGESKV